MLTSPRIGIYSFYQLQKSGFKFPEFGHKCMPMLYVSCSITDPSRLPQRCMALLVYSWFQSGPESFGKQHHIITWMLLVYSSRIYWVYKLGEDELHRAPVVALNLTGNRTMKPVQTLKRPPPPYGRGLINQWQWVKVHLKFFSHHWLLRGNANSGLT